MLVLFRPTIRACLLLAALLGSNVAARAEEPIKPIARRLPPVGKELDEATHAALAQRLAVTKSRLEKHAGHAQAADVEIFTSAVELALKFNEFYGDKDAVRAAALLDGANARLDALDKGETPWASEHGLVVRGYRSSIDGSVQPYGLVIPKSLVLDKPVPLYVWLHGRGDQQTNVAFLHERMTKSGQIAPDDAIVVHPFGRHCIGFKSAGEIDVLEAVDDVCRQYKIDPRRIVVLMGFSMGGAGCWHIGAHYADRWAAMSPGAGFAETQRYTNTKSEGAPWYERKLWGVYDVPCYTRNLFNLPVVAYSGESDKQIQAARVMEEAFQHEGETLTHLIGPGMGHQYHADTLAEILQRLKVARDRGLDTAPRKVSLQTRTLRYHKLHWVDVRMLREHWQDARVDAELVGDDELVVTTRNVESLQLRPPGWPRALQVKIDGQTIDIPKPEDKGSPLALVQTSGVWQAAPTERNNLVKLPKLQGPIDDAFLDPFLVVLPSKPCKHAAVDRWVKFEQERFLARWRGLFRGTPRVKRDVDVTDDDMQKYHLLLWGDAQANAVIARLSDWGPIRWRDDTIEVGEQTFDARSHVPVYIYPNREALHRYIVVNSGPTFREAHDGTNSQQNPKLPDWAIVDLSQPPIDKAPGRIAAADFFDEHWQLRAAPAEGERKE